MESSKEYTLRKMFSYDFSYIDNQTYYGKRNLFEQQEKTDPEAAAINAMLEQYESVLQFVCGYFGRSGFDIAKIDEFPFPTIIFSRKRETWTCICDPRGEEKKDPRTLPDGTSNPDDEPIMKQKDRPVLGKYYDGTHSIILYMENIREKNKKDPGDWLIPVFVHEMFHAFHRWYMTCSNVSWRDNSKDERGKKVKEALAKAVEYQWIAQRNERPLRDLMADTIREALKKDVYTDSPYKYALPYLDENIAANTVEELIRNSSKGWTAAHKILKRDFNRWLDYNYPQ